MWIKNEMTGQWGAGFQVATIHAAKPGYYEIDLYRQGDLRMGGSEVEISKDMQEKLERVVLLNQTLMASLSTD